MWRHRHGLSAVPAWVRLGGGGEAWREILTTCNMSFSSAPALGKNRRARTGAHTSIVAYPTRHPLEHKARCIGFSISCCMAPRRSAESKSMKYNRLASSYPASLWRALLAAGLLILSAALMICRCAASCRNINRRASKWPADGSAWRRWYHRSASKRRHFM